MRLKKLKRLLSLTLSAAMVASMLTVPVRAEGITDQPVPVLEESADELEDMSADEVTDETEDSEVPDVEEPEADDEAVAGEDEAEAPVVNAPAEDAGDVAPVVEDGTTEGTETPIVVGGESTKTLQAAIAEAREGAVKTIELAGDVTLAASEDANGYNLDGLTIDTKGFMITIAEGTTVKLNGGTIKNEKLAVEINENSTAADGCTMFNVAGSLAINGGTYETRGAYILSIHGNVVIDGGATFTATATETDIADRNYYDGTSLISVSEAGAKLVMKNATVNADLGNKTAANDCGMYGVSLNRGAEAEFGVDKDNGPTINSMFSAIAMNGIASPGRITIRGGNYTSSVSCPEGNEKFNSVLYLPASANVTISGGTFTSAKKENCHVISAPYSVVNGNKVRMNLNISGGTFINGTGEDVFFGAGFDKTDTTKKVNLKLTGGKFSSNPSDYVAEGYGAYLRDDNMYEISSASVAMIGNTGYESLEDALAEAIGTATEANKVTIDLAGDVEFETSKPYDLSNITINTHGKMIKVPAGVDVTLSNATINNDEAAEATADGKLSNDAAGRKIMLAVLEGGKLTVNGGTYTSIGAQMVSVNGEMTAEGATFTCDAQIGDISGVDYYDGSSLVGVIGTKAVFTMKSGTVNANVGNGTDCGIYGICLVDGAKVVLGTETGTDQPTVDSMFAPIGMNGSRSPGTIVVNGGTFKSHVAVAGDSNWNAALYLSAKANVTIKGGTFIANHGTNGDIQHVISVPYANAGLNLAIEGGTFKVEGATADDALFYNPGKDDADNKNDIIIRGGSFGFDPADYLAGCCKAEQNATTNLWDVSSKEDGSHVLTWVAKKDSTCWDEGVIGHYECLACGKMYTTKTDTKEELSLEETAIPRKDHAGHGELVEAVAATCTETGMNVHFKCKNCGMCYDTMDALDADTKGTGKAESEYVTQATGHEFVKEDGTIDVTFDWSGFSLDTFKAGEASGVTAKRTCVNPKCSRKDATLKGEQTATVTVDLKAGSSLQIADCTAGQDIIFVATAVFASGEGANALADGDVTPPEGGDGDGGQDPVPDPNTATAEHTIKVTAKAHDYSMAKFNWDAFDATTFQKNQSNGVVATNKCPVCEAAEETGTVTVTCDGYPEDHTLVCSDGPKKFVATAAFGKTGFNKSESDERNFTAPHDLNEYTPYKAPTCTSTGQWGYYKCTDCKNYYLGEDSAIAGETIDVTPGSEDITIKRRPHSFVVKGLKWTDETNNTAKVIFHCANCKEASFEIPCDKVERKEGDATGSRQCGKEVTWTYTATYKFAQAGIVESEDGTKVSYDAEKAGDKAVERTGELTKKVTEPHELEMVENGVSWIASGQEATNPGTGVTEGLKVYDINEGIQANLRCKHCGGTIRVTNKHGITDTGTSIEDTSVLAAVNTVLLTDPAKTIAATCAQEGMATYQVRVSYDNNDGQGMQQIYSEELATATNVNPNAHNWSDVEWVTWKPVMAKDENGADTTEQATATITVDGKAYTVPVYEISAKRTCGNTGCTVGEQTHTATVGADPTDAQKAGFHVGLDYSVREKTCTISGRVVYRATAYMGTEEIAEYATPAVYTEEAEGHNIVVDWDWNEKTEGNTLVGYNYVQVDRYCTKCSENEDDDYRIIPAHYRVDEAQFLELDLDDEGFVEELPRPTVDGLTVGFNGSPATCTTAGRVSYTTMVKFGEVTYKEEKVIVNDVLGHEEKWSINWQPNADGTDANAWTVTAEKKCIRTNCPNGGAAIATQTLIPKFEQTPADQINCVTPGMKTWTVEFAPTDAPLEEGAVLQKTEAIPANDNHDYAPATATWVWTFDEGGKPVGTVVFRRVCSRDTSHVETEEVQAPATDANKIADCTKDAELVFIVEVPKEADGTTAWTMAEGASLEETFYWTAGTHNAIEVAEKKTDCNAEGWDRHYKCTRCENTYTTASCRVPYDLPEGRLGHLYGDPEYQWVEGKEGLEVKAVFTCTRNCTDTPEAIAGGFTRVKVVKATVGQPYVVEEASCADAPADKAQDGRGYYPVTVDLAERLDNIAAGNDLFESEISGKIPAGQGNHVYQEGLCKWCGKVEPNTLRAIFHGFDGSQTQIIVYRKNANGIIGNQPFVTPQTGFEFEGWKIGADGELIATFDALKTAFTDAWNEAGQTLDVYTSYRSLGQSGSLKIVKRIGGVDGEGEAVADVVLGGIKEVTAEATVTKDGTTYHFAGWEIGGTKVSTSLTYGVYIDSTEEIVVTAVYEEERVEEVPLVTITNKQALGTIGNYSLAFTSTNSIPEGYTIEEIGFLYSLSATVTEADMTYDTTSTKVKKYIVTGSKANVLTIAIPDTRLDNKVSVKAYVKWTNGTDSGIAYSGFVQNSWNELNGTVTPPAPAE